LAGAIGGILDDPQLARRLGEENYRISCEHHDGRRNAARFAAIYDRVAAMGSRAGAADQTVGAELHV
jgi:glycosyltransferase involved in cell wall biosynthesis